MNPDRFAAVTGEFPVTFPKQTPGNNLKEELHMHKNLSHEEIAQRFVDAKVIVCCPGRNFVTLKIVTVSDLGWHGINFGRFNSHACFLPAFDVARLIGSLRGATLTTAALEAGTQASLSE